MMDHVEGLMAQWHVPLLALPMPDQILTPRSITHAPPLYPNILITQVRLPLMGNPLDPWTSP
jgi:hypothetical protein